MPSKKIVLTLILILFYLGIAALFILQLLGFEMEIVGLIAGSFIALLLCAFFTYLVIFRPPARMNIKDRVMMSIGLPFAMIMISLSFLFITGLLPPILFFMLGFVGIFSFLGSVIMIDRWLTPRAREEERARMREEQKKAIAQARKLKEERKEAARNLCAHIIDVIKEQEKALAAIREVQSGEARLQWLTTQLEQVSKEEEAAAREAYEFKCTIQIECMGLLKERGGLITLSHARDLSEEEQKRLFELNKAIEMTYQEYNYDNVKKYTERLGAFKQEIEQEIGKIKKRLEPSSESTLP